VSQCCGCGVCFVLYQCNNPKTKEPKLDAAMRIIPEWKDRDAEIRRLWDRVYSVDQASSVSSSNSNTHSTRMPCKCVLCWNIENFTISQILDILPFLGFLLIFCVILKTHQYPIP